MSFLYGNDYKIGKVVRGALFIIYVDSPAFN